LPNLEVLLDSLRLSLDTVDVFTNVLGYVPLGIVLANRRPMQAFISAGLLSSCAEVMQLFSVGRAPQIVDVAANLAGTGLGMLLAARWSRLLPQCIAVTRVGASMTAAAAALYVALGAGHTAETILDQLYAWRDVPLWMTTNTRGALSEGRIEAHWSFDSVDHGMISDVSGNGVDGEIANNPTLTPGTSGSAILLNGEQWVDFGKPEALRLMGSMTLSAWIRPLAFPSDDAAIISSLTNHQVGYQLDLTVDQGPRTVGFKIRNSTGDLMARYGRWPIVQGRWYHVAGVYDAASRTLDVFVNGRRDSGCLMGTVTDGQQASDAHVFVGRRAGLAGFEFIGAIDEVEIQSRPRTEAEIQAESRAPGRVTLLPPPPQASGEGTDSGGGECPGDLPPPRVAGPLILLGMLIAVSCFGLWHRRTGYDIVAVALCFLAGAAAPFWLPPGTLEPAWLAGLYLVAGGVIVVFSGRHSVS
jgi:hypothetical protein